MLIIPGCKQLAVTPVPSRRRASSNVNTMFAYFERKYKYEGKLVVGFVLSKFNRARKYNPDATTIIRLGFDRFSKSVDNKYVVGFMNLITPIKVDVEFA